MLTKKEETLNIDNFEHSHNALSGNTVGILQEHKVFSNKLRQNSTQILNNGRVLSQKSDRYNINTKTNKKTIFENNKTYFSNINYSPTDIKLRRLKNELNNEETATAIALLSLPNLPSLIQPTYEHFSERKPFDNEEASFEAGPQRAPFESNPAFPSDPGDMPLGAGNWVLVFLGVVYVIYKYLFNQKKYN